MNLQRIRRDAHAARARLDALSAIVRATGRELEPGLIVSLAMRRIARLLPVRAWLLLVAAPGQSTLVIEQSSSRRLDRLRGVSVPFGEGVLGRAAQRRRLLTGRSGTGDGPPRPALPGRLAACPVVAVPLLSRGRVVGVMALLWRGGRHPVAHQTDLAATLLEPVAVALDSAILLRRSEELSVTDDLTRLYNCRYLNAALRREVERSRRYRMPVSLIFLDLDGFKNVNDRHGHLTGSRTLVEVGAVLRSTVREIDVVARFGGDEFCVVLPQTGPRGAMVIAERIRERIARTTFMRGHGLEVRVTASFGIASFPEHGVSGDDLIARADQAMYAAKAAGKDAVRIAPMALPRAASGRG
jgi:diguanylate cyclase (GGDEF)-like protein